MTHANQHGEIRLASDVSDYLSVNSVLGTFEPPVIRVTAAVQDASVTLYLTTDEARSVIAQIAVVVAQTVADVEAHCEGVKV